MLVTFTKELTELTSLLDTYHIAPLFLHIPCSFTLFWDTGFFEWKVEATRVMMHCGIYAYGLCFNQTSVFTHKFLFSLITVNRTEKKKRKAPKIERRAEKESPKGDISKKCSDVLNRNHIPTLTKYKKQT